MEEALRKATQIDSLFYTVSLTVSVLFLIAYWKFPLKCFYQRFYNVWKGIHFWKICSVGNCFASNFLSPPPSPPNHNTHTHTQISLVSPVTLNAYYGLSCIFCIQTSYPFTIWNFTVLNGTFCMIHKIILFLTWANLIEHLVQIKLFKALKC